ncbi:hypothetical protein CHLNCDRAFT_140366 [Chlorella variabilis]|uniref:Uncharacterized protein n=1 Tax=Chlorella variabilis TaxID=554065 RepID=E1Z6V9_CHLVA|nr:hypothetical protein CHLNCDRAFT_140366 [Chlorella variabilis]EFN58417.1 hypothetical protein CHLNCDRAFT_140366 [Chlorella variabilis]|eukprot:XP_005850519.1 hypothetical protein CHLNCDRAFT_140366 [Chlorella variabilis]
MHVAAASCRQQAVACLRSTAAARPQRAQPGVARQQVQQQQRRPAARRRLAVHASTAVYGSEWATPKDAYLTVGLCHCYVKEDGKLADKFIIEPITANSLECMAKGARTSFTHVFSLRLEEALQRSKAAYPAEFAEGTFCEDYETRCDACARTWMRPHAMDNLLDIVPLGQLKSNFNYSTADKRVLNADNIVNDDDNIKQDLSIDVYGRTAKEEAAAKLAESAEAAAPAAASEEEEEADDMDALLSV